MFWKIYFFVFRNRIPSSWFFPFLICLIFWPGAWSLLRLRLFSHSTAERPNSQHITTSVGSHERNYHKESASNRIDAEEFVRITRKSWVGELWQVSPDLIRMNWFKQDTLFWEKLEFEIISVNSFLGPVSVQPAREIFQRALILSAGDSKQKIAQSSQAARTNLKIDQNGNSNIFFKTTIQKRENTKI